jgi:hypothetical protein
MLLMINFKAKPEGKKLIEKRAKETGLESQAGDPDDRQHGAHDGAP